MKTIKILLTTLGSYLQWCYFWLDSFNRLQELGAHIMYGCEEAIVLLEFDITNGSEKSNGVSGAIYITGNQLFCLSAQFTMFCDCGSLNSGPFGSICLYLSCIENLTKHYDFTMSI